MTYFLFSITNRCNKACPYCIAKDYVNNPAYPDKITKRVVFDYFGARAKEGDLVEITGGEPTLVAWLEEFIAFLNDLGIKILLRTNGFKLFRNIYPNLAIAFNPHNNGFAYTAIRSLLLSETDIIIKPKITNSQTPEFSNDENSPLSSHPFEEMRFVTADGNIRAMSCSGMSIGSISGMGDTGKIYAACPRCPFILGAWNLISRLEAATEG